ncbi:MULTISPECIES: hypothetical protein [Bacillus cereus group]|uniref:hypothetical protein n=1 Tax=Bacillus cereus group TaxID=86661 RepID=UPI0002791CAC|nr:MULTISPECIES: hypothetical protein [Bacillus cereus group]EJP82007.1 hypothetical protein IC3_05692 [Bacillus cereus VD142]QWG42844.1 hypothetical protein EXW35_31985 [Bacillus mycoides]QWI47375.1 hypothetical protein EXW55_31670 [Bacillus mycoides]
MVNTKQRVAKRRKALNDIQNLVGNASNLLIIHYSCESFYDIKDGRTPRITSIAVRFFNTGQTETFSIHKVAEKKGFLTEIENHYDELEKVMLGEFYKFVKAHQSFNWVHWNMRDINYGFQAIEHRFSVLGGKPTVIPDSQKFDLARKLVDIYADYADHPRLEKLIELNGITKKDFMGGAEEAKAFDEQKYVELHRSTLRKVDVFHSILERVIDKSLKTKSNWRHIYGLTPQGLFETIKDHWLFALVSIIIGAALSTWFGKFF